MAKQGNLSIHSENIFPIIKKWLYSDQDIFVRELISNACDAILKFKKLCSMGEATDNLNEPFEIRVTTDTEKGTITISDNGIGMTEEEIEKYITQIAFSGAEDFLTKYKDKMDDEQIIGHFGLGFYSSFMVSSEVQINTLSYQGGEPLLWTCDGGTTYELAEGTRTKRGTDIILHISEESREFLGFYHLSEIIKKYCSFMPIPIYVVDATKKEISEDTNEPKIEEVDIEEIDELTDVDGIEDEIIDIDTEAEVIEEPKEKPINDITPLYTKKPSECTDEEYKTFYRETFHDYQEPLFWIHLNMDYPFKLKGILYFPKLKNEYELIEGKIKLYNNQVFVAENIKEVIPEFLLLLKGVLDCPDLPLNVSRSFLQNDGFVKKISDYITKKVADKLISLSKKENDNYKKFWDDIAPFIKYGCIREEKFAKKLMDYILYKTIDEKHVTLKEYLDKAKETHENKIFYVSDKNQQSQYIRLFKDNGLDAVYLPHPIDNSFISLVEGLNQDVKFMRIDSDISGILNKEEADKTHEASLSSLFQKVLNNSSLKVSVENLKSESTPSMILVSEEGRRMQEMMKTYGMDIGHLPPQDLTLILNQNHPLIKALYNENIADKTKDLLCHQLYDLALLSNQSLAPDAMKDFLSRSHELLLNLTA
ncbi:molecular chaperone HtpG [Candidatus Epulonipiscium fishelsonii]|nr:molecular chaperone HtpG [Epulopiscium sp. SCG-C06WGA-EpuloA1]